jgi:hypothetical protein
MLAVAAAEIMEIQLQQPVVLAAAAQDAHLLKLDQRQLLTQVQVAVAVEIIPVAIQAVRA